MYGSVQTSNGFVEFESRILPKPWTRRRAEKLRENDRPTSNSHDDVTPMAAHRKVDVLPFANRLRSSGH